MEAYVAASIVGVLVLLTVLLVRWVWRALSALFRGAEHELEGSGSVR